MPYSIRKGRIHTEGIQFASAFHCNLRCADCLTLSSTASPRYTSPDTVAADLESLGRVLHAREVRILGGEPLLNPAFGELTKLAKESGIADEVTTFTNGRFLDRLDKTAWRNLDLLNVSIYPESPPPPGALETARKLAQWHGVRLRLFRRHRFHTRVVNTPQPLDLTTRLIYWTCRAAHYDHCHWVHEGRLYRCAMPLFLPEYLQKLGRDGYVPEHDGLALDGDEKLYDRAKGFFLTREVPESCRYCLGCFGKRQPHRQLTREELEDPAAMLITRETHLSRPRMAAHLASHARHLAISRLRGGIG